MQKCCQATSTYTALHNPWSQFISGLWWVSLANTTNFWPLYHAFLSQRHGFVATSVVITTIFTFGCDRLVFCHEDCFVAISVEIVAKSKCYRNKLLNGCNKWLMLPRFDLRCGQVYFRCNTKVILQLFILWLQ